MLRKCDQSSLSRIPDLGSGFFGHTGSRGLKKLDFGSGSAALSEQEFLYCVFELNQIIFVFDFCPDFCHRHKEIY
jgi:hypothetical protein